MKDSQVSQARGKVFRPFDDKPLVIETVVVQINAVSQSRSGEIIRTVPVSLPRVKFLERPEMMA